MFLLMRRYLPTLFVTSFTTACLWAASIIYAEGVIPILAGVVWVMTTLLTLPVLAYLDFRDMRAQMKELKEAFKQDGSLASTRAVESVIGSLGGRFGIPESLLTGAAKIAEEQARARLKTNP